MNRAQRRQHVRRHSARQRPLISGHGRAVIVYDEVTDLARTINLDQFAGDQDLIGHVFPGLTGTDELHMVPGVSPPRDVLEWAKGAIVELRKLAPVSGSRVMVSAWCEHIRDEAAATFPFSGHPALTRAFADHPTAWFVVATMPRDEERARG